ncbi:MAG: hypothetical protein ACI9VS_000301 [Candidatus Binatia bacterium]|jgi:hypothetical protein
MLTRCLFFVFALLAGLVAGASPLCLLTNGPFQKERFHSGVVICLLVMGCVFGVYALVGALSGKPLCLLALIPAVALNVFGIRYGNALERIMSFEDAEGFEGQ